MSASFSRPSGARNRGQWVLICLTISLAVWISYAPILPINFTGWDTLVHLKTASERISSPVRFFLEPLTPVTGWYRPMSGFSYGIDFALWGLNPFGYQFTDVFLHWSVALGVAVLAYRATGRLWAAGLGGILVVLHPITVPVVVNIAQRHDILMTFGIVWSLVFVDRGLCRQSKDSILYWLVSVPSFAIAVGAKEPGLVALPLVLWLFLRHFIAHRTPIPSILVRVVPFLAVAIGYLILRLNILRGLSPPDEFESPWDISLPFIYLKNLLLPGRGSELVWVLLFLIVAALVLLSIAALKDRAHVTWIVLFVIWIFVPLGLYLAVGVDSFRGRYGYVMIVPTILLAVILLTIHQTQWGKTFRIACRGAQAILILMILAWLPSFPIFQPTRNVPGRELAAGEYIRQFDKVVSNLPIGTRIDLEQVPPRLVYRNGIQTWLGLKWGFKQIIVERQTETPLARGNVRLFVTLDPAKGHATIHAQYDSLFSGEE